MSAHLDALARAFNASTLSGEDITSYAELKKCSWVEALDLIGAHALALVAAHNSHVRQFHINNLTLTD